MASKWHGATCPECGKGTLHDGERPQIVEYRGVRYESQQTGAFCDVCGDGMVVEDSAEEARWEEFRNQVNAQQAKELAEIRDRLRLTQEQASKISGGGHNAFSRYERQEAQPVVGIVNLFRLLDKFPILVGELLPERATPVSNTTTWTAGVIGYGALRSAGAEPLDKSDKKVPEQVSFLAQLPKQGAVGAGKFKFTPPQRKRA